jgi:uncharacterized protein YndB with AHSA1/START domain
MTFESRHVSTTIDRPAADVYDYAADPTNLPAWAHGLTGSVRLVEGRWTADSPMGPITIAFAPRNDFGVLDHQVTTASGETFHNPMRVIGNADGCDVVFTVHRWTGTTDEEFARDTAAVQADLHRLRDTLARR